MRVGVRSGSLEPILVAFAHSRKHARAVDSIVLHLTATPCTFASLRVYRALNCRPGHTRAHRLRFNYHITLTLLLLLLLFLQPLIDD